ncbi:hypothetical protein [Streptomyces sp. NPDC051183]|uniref:hypothetical protein n=1 Tax=Streptomyces sp. NPDC051183 TaxID=3155165 RepID=UPI0034186984
MTETSPAPEHGTPPATEIELAGLRLRLVPVPWARSVGGCLAVACGSRDDPPTAASTAHLAEHVRALSGAGHVRRSVPVFAQTDIARTLFRATAAPEAAADLAARLVDVLGDASVDEATLESERTAVELETARMDSSALLRAGGLFAAAAADEPGMDSIARTRREDVAAVTHRQVAALTAWGYRADRAVLAVAGPPEALRAVPDAVAARLARHPHPAAAARPTAARPTAAAATPRLRLPALDGLLAVTLTRPRQAADLHARAVLGDRGPLVAAGLREGVPLLGRTTVENAEQAVDVLCWKPAGNNRQLAEHLPAACTAQEADDTVRELAARQARHEHAFTTHTPMAQALAAALDDPAAPRRITGRLRLAVWRVTDGIPVPVPVPAG